MHDLLSYDFNLYYNLIKKPLLERAIYSKKKKKLKNSNIKTSERLKNIKESDDWLLRNYQNITKYIWLNNREI